MEQAEPQLKTYIYKNKTYTPEELKAIRHSDFLLYTNITTTTCYKTNDEYRAKKKQKMKEYYEANKEKILERNRAYKSEWYQVVMKKKPQQEITEQILIEYY